MKTNQLMMGFAQIADWVCDRILEGKYQADDRIPSVRELAELMEVNPNTIVRSYEKLQREEVIYMQRGMGYFVVNGALERIREQRRKAFFDQHLPNFLSEMQLLGIKPQEVITQMTSD